MTDFKGLQDTVQLVEPHTIIHLAGVSGAACDDNRRRSEEINVTGTRVLRDAAATVGTSHIIFASTAAVYGDHRTQAVRETDVVDPRSNYAEMKFHAEEILREPTDSAAFSSIAMRIFNVYGENFTDSLIHRLLTSTPKNPARLKGFDTFVRDYVHAADVAEAIMLALHLPSKGHLTLNIGSGIPTSNRQLVKCLGARSRIHYEVGDAVQSCNYADISLARDVLGYEPARTLQDFRPSPNIR